MDEESEIFIVHIATLEALPGSAKMAIHPSRVAQIAALKQDEALTKVPSKYTDYTDVISFNLAIKLPENTCINKHAIKLQNGE